MVYIKKLSKSQQTKLFSDAYLPFDFLSLFLP